MPISVGMDPVTSLISKSNVSNALIVPTCVGIVPDKSFSAMPRYCSIESRPSSVGSGPLKPLLITSKRSSPTRIPISDARLPVNSLPPSESSFKDVAW